MAKFRGINYINGFTNPKIPKISAGFILEIIGSDIVVWNQSFVYSRHKEIIPLNQLVAVQSAVTQTRKSLSAGKAVIGTVLLPGVGTLIGAAMGGKRKDYSLTISHMKDGRQVNLELDTKFCAQIENAIVEAGKQNGLSFKTANAATGAVAQASYLDEIEKLAGLRDKAIITEQEFQAQKKHILESQKNNERAT